MEQFVRKENFPLGHYSWLWYSKHRVTIPCIPNQGQEKRMKAEEILPFTLEWFMCFYLSCVSIHIVAFFNDGLFHTIMSYVWLEKCSINEISNSYNFRISAFTFQDRSITIYYPNHRCLFSSSRNTTNSLTKVILRSTKHIKIKKAYSHPIF